MQAVMAMLRGRLQAPPRLYVAAWASLMQVWKVLMTTMLMRQGRRRSMMVMVRNEERGVWHQAMWIMTMITMAMAVVTAEVTVGLNHRRWCQASGYISRPHCC